MTILKDSCCGGNTITKGLPGDFLDKKVLRFSGQQKILKLWDN